MRNLVQETPKGTVSSVQASVTIDLSRSPDILSEGGDHHDAYPCSNSSTHPVASHGQNALRKKLQTSATNMRTCLRNLILKMALKKLLA